MNKKEPIAILEQFVEKGKTISYMIEFMGHRDYWGHMPEAIVLFKIYDKKNPLPSKPKGIIQKLLDFGKYKRLYRSYKKSLSNCLIASQSHSECSL